MKGNASIEVRDTSLVVCGTVSTVERRLSEGEYCLKIRCRTVEE